MNIIYKHDYGDESVPASSIVITKNKDDYKIVFTQESLEPEYFMDIKSRHKNKKTIKNEKEIIQVGLYMCKRTIEMNMNISFNPKPETLFTII